MPSNISVLCSVDGFGSWDCTTMTLLNLLLLFGIFIVYSLARSPAFPRETLRKRIRAATSSWFKYLVHGNGTCM